MAEQRIYEVADVRTFVADIEKPYFSREFLIRDVPPEITKAVHVCGEIHMNVAVEEDTMVGVTVTPDCSVRLGPDRMKEVTDWWKETLAGRKIGTDIRPVVVLSRLYSPEAITEVRYESGSLETTKAKIGDSVRETIVATFPPDSESADEPIFVNSI
jgi:hypothetical protein